MTRPDISKIKQRLEPESPEPAKKPEGPPKPQISPETLQQASEFVKEFAEQNAPAPQEEVERTEVDTIPEDSTLTEEDTSLDTVFYRNTTYDNKIMRGKIEDRCTDLDFADLILTGRVSQVVPILPGKFNIEFQTLLGHEDFWVQTNAASKANDDWSAQSWMGYARLALSTVAINGDPLPEHLSNNAVDSVLFQKKFDALMSKGTRLLEYMLINLNWFYDREKKLWENDFELLKNG